jgi:hypothetical protein
MGVLTMSSNTQRRNACKSCPWLDNDSSYCFDPSTLERTIVADLAAERLQGCHSSPRHFCNGYLSFVKYRLDGGLEGLYLARMAIVLKLLNPDIVPKLNTFESVEMMLKYHRKLAKHSVKIHDEQ